MLSKGSGFGVRLAHRLFPLVGGFDRNALLGVHLSSPVGVCSYRPVVSAEILHRAYKERGKLVRHESAGGRVDSSEQEGEKERERGAHPLLEGAQVFQVGQ